MEPNVPVPTSHIHMAAAVGCESLPLIRGESCVHFPKVIYNTETEYMCLSFLFFKLSASVKLFEINRFIHHSCIIALVEQDLLLVFV